MKFRIKSELIYSIILLFISLFILFSLSLNFIKDTTLLFFIKGFYQKICHQIENRCLLIDGKPMFICSRCTGIYSGAFILFLILKISTTFRKILDKFDFRIIFLFALPLLIDWSLNFIFKVETTNLGRFLTGFLISLIPVYFLNSLIINRN